jgi:hypothetical protein
MLQAEEAAEKGTTQGWPPMNADERRLKTKRLPSEVRVHLRSSAANMPFQQSLKLAPRQLQ